METGLFTLHAPHCHYAIIDNKVKHVSRTEIELVKKLRRAGIKLSEYTAVPQPVNAQYDCITKWEEK